MSNSPQKLGKLRVSHSELNTGRIGLNVVTEKLTAEALYNAGQRCADVASADDADRLPRHVEPDQIIEREITIPRAVIGVVDAAIERHHQRYRMLRDRRRCVSRDAHHGQAKRLGGVQVDIVKSRRPHRDQPRPSPRQLPERGRIQYVGHKRADGRKAGGKGRGICIKRFLEEDQLLSVLGVGLNEMLALEVMSAEERYSHMFGGLLCRRRKSGPSPRRSVEGFGTIFSGATLPDI